eukprot:CAMPEP_0197565072 /NCGR_PEP_ID=MMETSP1320-20131121/31492_1 /TAXON_ID=91990 /ORGANISM="Bolidomonas sp., Strain RCC2347" /LENGTH=140 /DNA_ID=CAMNT_0043127033 /DNA_START=88 /DNA_END=506 /DNA_ORIENTATION=-
MKTQSCTSSEVDALCRRAEKLTNPTKLADVGQKKRVSNREARLNKALIGKALPRTLLLILLLLLLPPPTSPLLESSIYHRLNRLSATTITTPTTPCSTFTTTTTTLHATPPTNTSRPSPPSRPPNPALGLNPTLNPYQLG